MVACCTINIISVLILVTPPPGSELYVLRRKPCTIDSQSMCTLARSRVIGCAFKVNFEGTTYMYDTRSHKSCLVFRVCGNYALMRVVHCGVLAARASLFIWIVHAVGSCCTLRVSIKILYARVITEKAAYGTVHEKIAPLIYYKNVIKMHHVCIAITSQRLTLSTSYFHHFILHHFSTVKCILESWTISVPTFLRAIPPGVQNYHIFV